MAIDRGKGFTPSERYLSEVADRTFLRLWTYPNTFMDRKLSSVGCGKEICDLLVVCGDDVIIFSDKSIAWPTNPTLATNWSRWYKKAVSTSVKQIVGAERWLSQYPDRVFLDQACTKKLPIVLPPLERRRVHGIAIALGAFDACREYCNDDDGSLMVLSELKGDDHIDLNQNREKFFSIGDVNPTGNFVHVFDKTALDLVMLEMDTVTDFISYLRKRAEAIRTEKIAWASSEADMLGSYMQTQDHDDGSYTFLSAAHMGVEPDTKIVIAQHEYAAFISGDAYKAKKAADEISYSWDRIINVFLDHIMAETTVAVDGYGEIMGAKTEPGLRLMACEDRFSRRVLSKAFLEFISKSREVEHHRFARVVTSIKNGSTGTPIIYIFMILVYPKTIVLDGGYAQYRQVRISMLETYCYAALQENRSIHYAVGIAMDSPNESEGKRGRSEDFLAIHVEEWSQELESNVDHRRKTHEIMIKDRLEYTRLHEDEYPALDGFSTQTGNSDGPQSDGSAKGVEVG